MVLRAIRWVNPKRMFPIMNLKKEDMEKMSQEEFEKAFVELAEYRREAHVINNRYNQMLRMIDAGQLPYFIQYANIPGQRYKDLAQYRERAQRLGLGASDWGHEIDQQAEMFRKVFTKKHEPIDVIEGLWEDGKGEPAPPPFMRVHRRFKEDRLMRAERRWFDRFKFTDSNGNEIIAVGETVREAADKAFGIYIETVEGGEREDFSDSEWESQKSEWIKGAGKPEKLKRTKLRTAQVWARQFIAVPKAEIREGEDVRMPAERDVEGAAAFLLRVPDPAQSWMDDKQWADLQRGKGPLTIGPLKAKVKIHYSEVSDDEIDMRVEERWTQEGRAGGRKEVHRGARSQRPSGHRTEPPLRPIVARRPQAPPAASAPAPKPWTQGKGPAPRHHSGAPNPGDGQPDTASQQANDAVAQGIADIIGKDIDLFLDVKGLPDNFGKDYFAKENIAKIQNLADAGSSEGIQVYGGLHSSSTKKVTMKDGREWLYKVAAGEQFGEALHHGLDRALNINVSPFVQMANVGIDTVTERGADIGYGMEEAGEKGGGHMMEWLQKSEGWERATQTEISWEYLDTREKRATVWGTMLLDMLTGNTDRHSNNVYISKKHGIVPIDSGFAGGYSEWDSAEKLEGSVHRPRQERFRQDEGRGRVKLYGMGEGMQKGYITEEALRKELEEYYDVHMDPKKIERIATACQAKIDGNINEYASTATKDRFVAEGIKVAQRTA
jgi:hypothetical protein